MNKCQACDKWGKVYEVQTKRIAELEDALEFSDIQIEGREQVHIADHQYMLTLHKRIRTLEKRREQDDDGKV